MDKVTRRSSSPPPRTPLGAGSVFSLFGIPIQVLNGKPKEVFTQVMNNAFPAGTISVDDAVKQMTAAY